MTSPTPRRAVQTPEDLRLICPHLVPVTDLKDKDEYVEAFKKNVLSTLKSTLSADYPSVKFSISVSTAHKVYGVLTYKILDQTLANDTNNPFRLSDAIHEIAQLFEWPSIHHHPSRDKNVTIANHQVSRALFQAEFGALDEFTIRQVTPTARETARWCAQILKKNLNAAAMSQKPAQRTLKI